MSYQEFELYDRYEKTHWWFTGRRKIISTFLKFIPKLNEKKILEVGVGSGGNMAYLFNGFKERIGLEYSSDALFFAQKKLGNSVRLSQGDCNFLDKSFNEKFDVVAFMDVLYHANVEDVKSVLKQSSSVLNEDGYLLITDGAFEMLAGKHGESVNSTRRFTASQFSELLKEHFDIVKMSYWGLLLFFLMFVKRVIIDSLKKNISNSSQEIETDLISVPVVDDILYGSLFLESFILKFFDLPFGASIALVAKKKKTSKNL